MNLPSGFSFFEEGIVEDFTAIDQLVHKLFQKSEKPEFRKRVYQDHDEDEFLMANERGILKPHCKDEVLKSVAVCPTYWSKDDFYRFWNNLKELTLPKSFSNNNRLKRAIYFYITRGYFRYYDLISRYLVLMDIGEPNLEFLNVIPECTDEDFERIREFTRTGNKETLYDSLNLHSSLRKRDRCTAWMMYKGKGYSKYFEGIEDSTEFINRFYLDFSQNIDNDIRLLLKSETPHFLTTGYLPSNIGEICSNRILLFGTFENNTAYTIKEIHGWIVSKGKVKGPDGSMLSGGQIRRLKKIAKIKYPLLHSKL